MTVPSEVSRSGPYNGNGVTTFFEYKFRIVDEGHLRVIKRDADGFETTLVIGADYTVSGVGSQVGGNITTTVPPAAGETITILRNVPFVQETDLQNQGPYYAETVEDAFDLAAMRDQQLQEQVTRSVKIPASADVSALDTLIADIVRLGDSADSIDTVAENIDDVVLAADHLPEIQAAPAAAATATAAAGVATGAASTAVDARDAAIVAKNAAEASASDALASKNAAQDAEAASIDAKNQAQSAAGAAQGSAGAAAGSAAAALASENTAVANAEATADDRAAVAIDRAAVADDKDVAAGAASTAISSANAAQASATKADQWANYPEDVPVEPGKFSAYHWMEKAKTIAGGGVQTVAEATGGHVAIDLTDPENPVFDLKPDTIAAILGSLRWVRALGAAEDLNAIKEPGIYTQNQISGASGGTNYPVANAGMLEVLDGGGATNVQTAQRYTEYSQPPIVWQRMRRNAGNWSAWVVVNPALASKGEAEAGTETALRSWSPERVAQAIAALSPPGFGIGQNWSDVSASRAKDTAYQNTTGKLIFVAIDGSRSSSSPRMTAQVSPDGSVWTNMNFSFGAGGTGSWGCAFFVVPPGNYYRAIGTGTEFVWVELR